MRALTLACRTLDANNMTVYRNLALIQAAKDLGLKHPRLTVAKLK
jgi:hypothetical protein